MPLIAVHLGEAFSGCFLVLGTVPPDTAMTLEALKKAQVPVFAYGNFTLRSSSISSSAFIIFMMIKQVFLTPGENLRPRRRHRKRQRHRLLREIRR